MKLLLREDVNKDRNFVIKELRKGKIFVYPTDTIYGLGCNALIPKNVEKIRKIKNRYGKPFSVIVPDIHWVEKNCLLNENSRKWLKILPGPYTFILKLKNGKAIAEEINLGLDSIGIRIPDHWISEIVKEAGVPFVTTSVNLSGSNFMKEVKEINPKITMGVDYIIDEGRIDGKPSSIINLTGEREKIVKR
ncbi:MAG: L-threonylcarbamoyladenylate synthase [Nanoarchaeota archaeon]|nr:L-threonylcarbamoyladenylate synthase [Nanoarchaeota archaeon]